MPKKVSAAFIQQRSKYDLLNLTAEDVCPLSRTPISELIEGKDAVMVVIPERPGAVRAICCIYSREYLKQWLYSSNPHFTKPVIDPSTQIKLDNAHELATFTALIMEDLEREYKLYSTLVPLIAVIMFVFGDGVRSLIANDEMIEPKMYSLFFNVILILTVMDTYLNASRVKKTLLAPFFSVSQDRMDSWLGEHTVPVTQEMVDQIVSAVEMDGEMNETGKLKVA